jgi:hypothetical protein
MSHGDDPRTDRPDTSGAGIPVLPGGEDVKAAADELSTPLVVAGSVGGG